MKRLYFLVPTIQSTSVIVKELQEFGLKNDQIHVVGKNHDKLQAAHLHEAGILETTDVLHAMKLGARYGALAGLAVGVTAAWLLSLTWLVAALVVAGVTSFGALFGTWASSLVGISLPEPGVKKFRNMVKGGQLLMLVDIPKEQEQTIVDSIKRHHPEAKIETISLFI